MQLQYKVDAQRSLERFESWWLCENDTPLVEMHCTELYDFPDKHYRTVEDRWLDFEYRLDAFDAYCQHTHFLADSFPAFNPNLGPDLLATLWGSPMSFAPDTSWVSPIASEITELIGCTPNFDTYLWNAAIRFTEMSLERGNGKWLTMFHDLHPNADIPAALIGPQNLCLAFADDLSTVRKVVQQVTEGCIRAYEQLVQLTSHSGQPTLTWLPAPHQGRMYVPQCDFSAMVSTSMFQEAILPSILRELEHTDRAIYHLDGPDALRHLDILLEIPQIHGIQWVFGAGNGPARKWQPVYERILKAGKCIQVIAESPEDVVEIHEVFGPKGIFYSACFRLPLEESKSFLQSLGILSYETT